MDYLKIGPKQPTCDTLVFFVHDIRVSPFETIAVFNGIDLLFRPRGCAVPLRFFFSTPSRVFASGFSRSIAQPLRSHFGVGWRSGLGNWTDPVEAWDSVMNSMGENP